MVGTGRKKSIAFFISLGAGLTLVSILLYVGWVLLGWRSGILLFLGIVLLALIIAGVAINTTFLVREIRRNEQHDAFINAVTHELKTPVASIRLYVETLKTRAVDENKRNEFYGIILSDSDRLLGTIEQILRTGRVGSSSRKPHLAPMRLDELVNECVARARILHNIPPELLKYENGVPLPIRGDYDEVHAAVSNLIDNAVKYSGSDGGIEVVASERENRFAEVSVRDRGPGIAGPELKRIFKRFYRIHGPLATRVKGTGLGLYIVRSVAKRHGGRAWAESAGPGHGSTFTLQFPIARFDSTQAASGNQ
ncbi:MAG TPA: HAMP domain-containing sensor histidine kinase [Bryobacteraceae bacterium]|jgi:signal transduction histidine kinase|nr:HAMP domain-containing sensor histidine kinase [Bryobacteraceae bacterium]